MNIKPEHLWNQYERAFKLWPWFNAMERERGLPAFLLYAIGSRETGLNPDYARGKVHDDGHGWGLFGADDRWNKLDLPAFAGDPRAQAILCTDTLLRNYRSAGNWVDAVNAYGPRKARGHQPKHYGPDVLDRAQYLATRTRGARMRFVSRQEWGARAPRGTTRAPGMVHGVGVHYLGDGHGPTDHDRCIQKMREIQDFHTGPARGWADFAYNAAVCTHGIVLEGRGPKVRNAANGGGIYRGLDANAAYASILCLAGVDGPSLSPEERTGVNDAAHHLGVAGGEWLGHRDFLSTACPGDQRYNWVHSGHPGGEPAVEPEPEDDMGLFIYDFVKDGKQEGVFYSDGKLKWGVDGEEMLAFFATGTVKHLGAKPPSFHYKLDWHPGGEPDGGPAITPAARKKELGEQESGLVFVEVEKHRTVLGPLETALQLAPGIETGDPH